jgi:hypothetical protein
MRKHSRKTNFLILLSITITFLLSCKQQPKYSYPEATIDIAEENIELWTKVLVEYTEQIKNNFSYARHDITHYTTKASIQDIKNYYQMVFSSNLRNEFYYPEFDSYLIEWYIDKGVFRITYTPTDQKGIYSLTTERIWWCRLFCNFR